MAVLFVFIDGLGLAPAGPGNPLSELEGGPLAGLAGGRSLAPGYSLSLADACLGIPGIPQSATGGTSLFTGVNAPAMAGGHMQGYPNSLLRGVIAQEGLLRKARERGARVDFANAYTPKFFERGTTRHRSVTTVMAETSGIRLKRVDDLRRGDAVYRDFTNRILMDLNLKMELLSPEAAGGQLGKMARERDLLVYEFFQTDVAGHRGTFEDAVDVLEPLNRFLGAAVDELDPARDAFVLSSDHGNIEDMSASFHTANQVPILLWGKGLSEWPPVVESLSILSVSKGIHALLRTR